MSLLFAAMNAPIPRPHLMSHANKSTAHSKHDTQASKKADLAGPGIGDYAELEKILPQDYNPLLTPQRNAAGDFPSASATSKTISARNST